MSRGAGIIERRITDRLAATQDRALGIDDITDHAFGLAGAAPTRVQRLSATRATHRILRRRRLNDNRVFGSDTTYWKLYDWRATTIKGRLYFHPPDVPVRVWAVAIDPGGISWTEAEIIKVTKHNVMVRYAGETARLDRGRLRHSWAFWRAVRFVSSRTGRIAAELELIWWTRYGPRGSVPPLMQMPLSEAMALLGVPADYIKDDVICCFRRAAMKAHPDHGGTVETFRKLVEARDRLLAALGTSAPPPKPPEYAPKGERIIYGTVRSSQARLGAGRLRLRA